MEWWKYVHLRESEFEGPFYLYSSSVSSHPDLIWGWTCSEYALIALLRATCLVSSGFERFPSSDIARRQFPSLGGGIEPDSSWERASHKFSQIKANFSFWCSQLWIMAGKRGKLQAGVVWMEFNLLKECVFAKWPTVPIMALKLLLKLFCITNSSEV